MVYRGVITKMMSEYLSPIQYYWDMNGDFLIMNQLLNKELEIDFKGYECFNCGQDRGILSMGYCYVCFNKVPQTADFILRPELSQAHMDIENRDIKWEKEMQLQPHVVYLANSGNLKVGVTRKTQIPTRWIDQGATEAIELLEVENRYLAGLVEVALKSYISDKTNYKKMLTAHIPRIDLMKEKDEYLNKIPKDIPYQIKENKVYEMEYPVIEYPEKIKSVNLKKEPNLSGKLIGIKGQYLIFKNGIVFNIRNHEGYKIELKVKN